MSRVFQLGRPKGPSESSERARFERHGFVGNPFPEPGLERGVLYSGHMEGELERINTWLERTQNLALGDPVTPLAIRGTIGVGKTHLLKAIQDGLEAGGERIFVCRRALTEESMKNLLLATLLLHSLPEGDRQTPLRPEMSSQIPLLDRLVSAERLLHHRNAIHEAMERLGSESPLRAPLQKLIGMKDTRAEAEARKLLATWLLRGPTTPAQRGKIGVSSALDGEGQAVRAVADLLRMGQAAGLVKVWFVLLDQLEELYRPHVITPGRRARFLTDLRLLIDLAYEGAPIAVLLAWNTEVALVSGSAEDRLQQDYRALWRRLGTTIDLPGLKEKDIWPFAQAYLDAAPKVSGRDRERKAFQDGLQSSIAEVVATLKNDKEARLGPEHLMTARVLHHWRQLAHQRATT